MDRQKAGSPSRRLPGVESENQLITQIHSDDIKTSKFATDRQVNLLRPSGVDAATGEFFYDHTAESEQAVHEREHGFIVQCRANTPLPV